MAKKYTLAEAKKLFLALGDKSSVQLMVERRDARIAARQGS
jgi:hypothetical protein